MRPALLSLHVVKRLLESSARLPTRILTSCIGPEVIGAQSIEVVRDRSESGEGGVVLGANKVITAMGPGGVLFPTHEAIGGLPQTVRKLTIPRFVHHSTSAEPDILEIIVQCPRY